jgi:hypothetical protein
MASKMFSKAVHSCRIGNKPEECHWYYQHFVEWISAQGYHIELTGDEFELWLDAHKSA